jgi:hypothetical protein
MRARVGLPAIAARAAIPFVLAGALAGCGDAHKGPVSTLGLDASTPSTPASCASTVLATLERVARRIYHQGVRSERTKVALRLIGRSAPLREAVRTGDPAAAQAAAQALLASHHLTNLRVVRHGHVLADVGAPQAVTPLRGTIVTSDGTQASFQTSVWEVQGLIAETHGMTEASVLLRDGARQIAGSPPLPARVLAPGGTLALRGVRYRYTSFPVERFPSGSAREYVIRSLDSTAALCGRTEQDTVVGVLSRIARRVYEAEGGPRTLPQVRRVQRDGALLRAVAARDAAATRRAIEDLLTQHIVRMRVSDAGGALLSDVGGPDVLAPVQAPLLLGGRRIGSFVLSIQDDEGYLRLTRRLVGLKVLMRTRAGIVKNDLGPDPGTVPQSGSYSYRGERFRVFTFTATAFPSGPLTINVLVPIPYV